MAPRPRGRPSRKFEGKRMEEMLNHFRIENLGFDEKVVKTVAKQILREYDVGEGTEGAWCFLAQNNYQLLIEQILEYQENNQPEGSCAAVYEDCEDEPPNDEQALVASRWPSEMSATQENTPEHADGSTFTGENLLLTSGPAQDYEAKSPSPVAPKYLPCYGWINGDEEHDPDDLITLPPAGQIASEEKPQERRSKWDLRPEDP